LSGQNTGDTYTISGLPSIGTATTTTGSYTNPGPVTVTSTTTGGYSATLSVVDSNNSSSSTSCVLTAGTTTGLTTTGSTGPITITASPAQVETDNVPITLFATYSGFTEFTFAVTSSNVTNYTFTQSTTSATITASEATMTITVTAVGSGITSTIELEWGSGGTGGVGIGIGTGLLSCTLYNTFSSTGFAPMSGTFFISSSTGEALEITSYTTGLVTSSQPIVFETNPAEFEVQYPYAGTYELEVVAQSAVRSGFVCNNGQPMFNTIVVEP
jgi:hypothetical protein